MPRANFRVRQFCSAALMASVLIVVPTVTRAEEEPNPNAAALAEKARLEAQADVVEARAALLKARIDALGLPSFEGTRTVNPGAGAIEASMLSTTAVSRAARIIAGRLETAPAYNGNYILLAGDEELDFSQAGAILTQMDAIKILFDQIPPPPPPRSQGRSPSETFMMPAIAPVISAITAAAGLLRSNVELTALETDAISEEMLVGAIATRLGQRAIVPTALIGIVEECGADGLEPPACIMPAPTDPDDWVNRNLMHRFNRLVELRAEARSVRDRIPGENQTPAEQRYVLAADRAIARFDTFFTAVTTPDEEGIVAIGQAARLDLLRRTAARVVRVYVAEHSGSLVRTTNLLTTLGADPLRVSGALVARYQVTEPNTGISRGGGILTCQTALTSLRRIQQWNWSNSEGLTSARCQEQ